MPETLDAVPEARQRGRRSGGRAGNIRRGGTAAIHQMPWIMPQNRDAPVEPLSAEDVERVHNGAMRILEEIGILFLNDEALSVLKDAGCDVDMTTKNVRMDRAFVMEQVKKAPHDFTITPRNPERKVHVGGDTMIFVNVSSPPNAMDLDRGRRVGDRESFRDLMKLTQYFNCIHLAGGYPVEPVDIHASIRHLDAIYDKLTLTDKVCHAYSLGPARVDDAMEMVRIAGGLSHEEFDATPRMYTNINSSSPLKHDWPMLDGAMRLARRGQPVIVTPFTLAGAMAPVTIAGAVTQQTAEALCAIALLQCVRPGTPVVYGSFTSNVDMKSGRAGLRHAGIYARDPALRADGALLRPAAPRLERLRRKCAGCPSRVGERLFALGLRHGEGKHLLSLGRLARRRADGVLRKIRHGLRDAAAGDALHEAGADHRRRHRRRRYPRGRSAQPFLRCRPHAGAIRDRLLQPVPVRLAELRDMVGGGIGRDAEARQRGVEGDSGGVRAPSPRSGDRAGTSRVRRAPQARRRRPDRFLSDRRILGQMQRRVIDAEDAPKPLGGYAQAVEIASASRILFISGQIPASPDGAVPQRFEDQARLVWQNVIAQLRAAGMTLDNLVKVTYFLSDRKYIADYRRVRQEVLGDRRIALTTIITGIFDEKWLLEIEAIAAA